MADGQIERIVSSPPDAGGLTRTQGTKIMVGDSQMTGVTRIELVCDVNDVWRARIDCMVQPPADLSALSIIYVPTRWQRIKQWLARG